MIVRQKHKLVILQTVVEKLVNTVFSRMRHADIVSPSVEFGMQQSKSRLNCRLIVFKCNLCDMRRRDDTSDAETLHSLNDVGCRLRVGSAVINARHYMAVDIRTEAELGRSL